MNFPHSPFLSRVAILVLAVTVSFRVFAASSVNATKQLVTPVQILAKTLGRVDNQAPILARAYSAQNGLMPARYLKFEAVTAVGNHAGLTSSKSIPRSAGRPAQS